MKNSFYLILLAINIILLLADLIFGNNMPEWFMYGSLFFVMITTPIYLYLQLKKIKDMYKK